MRALLGLLLATPAFGFQQFEARQCHAIALTPDGAHLLALHSPASTLSVFAAGGAAQDRPVRIAEIPVGEGPVSVKARTSDEVWVVNEVSDTVSIVSLSARTVTATLRVPDEPADVCFAAGKAFISCARSRQVAVFDAVTRAPAGTAAVNGLYPRALAASADGTRVYAAALLSGNGTTILREEQAPAQPAPTNPSLPAPPKTALIVPAGDTRITWVTLDNDIAAIDTATLTVTRWYSGIGTHLFDLALHPDGSLWCANSDALNLTRFEPALRGEFARHRLTRLDPASAATVTHDLNAGIARATTPEPASIANALAQPTALAFTGSGSTAWVAAFNSDRVAEIDTTSGTVLRRVDLRSPGQDYRAMRGPRSLVLSSSGTRLFVLNKLSDTLTTIDTATAAVLSEQPLGSVSPMPAAIRAGRGILYDARLSGNGTLSCATCHLDADHDGLAWDLGDPGGNMVSVFSAELSIHDTTLLKSTLHPMKGPLVTQTLRGLALNDSPPLAPAAAVVTKFHWRGDKPSIQSFNSTFPNLMGGTLLPEADMDALAAYLLSITNHPNPNRNPDRTLKLLVSGGNAVAGRDLYNNHLKSHCVVCHAYSGGTDQNLDTPAIVDRRQPIKNPPLRLVYQRAGIFNPAAGQPSLSGFGLGADGTRHLLPKVHPYDLDQLRTAQELADVAAFILSFDTGTAPAVGYTATITAANWTANSTIADVGLLEGQATLGACDTIVTGTLQGRTRAFLYDPEAQAYRSDRSSEPPLTNLDLFTRLQPGDALTFAGVLPGSGTLASIDRDGDTLLNGDETPPALTIAPGLQLQWPNPGDQPTDWHLQTSPSPLGPWVPLLSPHHSAPGTTTAQPPFTGPAAFFRLRRNW